MGGLVRKSWQAEGDLMCYLTYFTYLQRGTVRMCWGSISLAAYSHNVIQVLLDAVTFNYFNMCSVYLCSLYKYTNDYQCSSTLYSFTLQVRQRGSAIFSSSGPRLRRLRANRSSSTWHIRASHRPILGTWSRRKVACAPSLAVRSFLYSFLKIQARR